MKTCIYCPHNKKSHAIHEDGTWQRCTKCPCCHYSSTTQSLVIRELVRLGTTYRAEAQYSRDAVREHWGCKNTKAEKDKYHAEWLRANGLASSMVALLLGYVQTHWRGKSVLCACDLCLSSITTLKSYGFEVMPPEDADKRINDK